MGIPDREPPRGIVEDPLAGTEGFAVGGDSPPHQEDLPGRIFFPKFARGVEAARTVFNEFLEHDPKGQRIKEHLDRTGRVWEATPKKTIAITVFMIAAAIVTKRLHERKKSK